MKKRNFEVKLEITRFKPLNMSELVEIGQFVQEITKIARMFKINVPIKFSAK